MKTLRSFSLAVIAFGVLAAFPAASHAQTMVGKFTLPHEAHWGRAVLPAGDYTVHTESVNSPTRLIIQKSSGETKAFVMPAAISQVNRAGKSELALVETDAGSFVSSMYLNDPGVEFSFITPKAKDNSVAGLQPAGVLSAAK